MRELSAWAAEIESARRVFERLVEWGELERGDDGRGLVREVRKFFEALAREAAEED